MSFNILALTGEQIRAARALSRTEQTELARLSGLSLETIKRLERIRGPVDANARTLRAIQDAFATIGVQFDGDDTGKVGVLQHPSAHGDPHPSPRQIERDQSRGTHRLIYHSRIARRADESLRPTLAFIHAEAQTLHAGLGLTGIIFAREGHLLQALEGDKDVVHQAYRAIASYPQHHDLHLLEDRATTRRQFPEFSFCCGLFAADFKHMADERAFEGGFTPSRLTPNEASGLLGVARDLQQTAPRNTRGNPGACTLASTCLDTTCGKGNSAPPRAIAPQAH
jgi:transcriptional regulator with XRE-family HTH domain